MNPVTHDEFIAHLEPGDIGLIHSSNVFAWLQSLYSHRFAEGPVYASHAFYVRKPPLITEANGLIIRGLDNKTSIETYLGGKTLVWIFRYDALAPSQLALMDTFADASVMTGGHYSVGGIWQFAKSWVTGKLNESDEGGVFCSELVSDIIKSAELPYIGSRPSWQIDPTFLLNWFLGDNRWPLVAAYDGARYHIA